MKYNNLYATPDPFAPKRIKDSDDYARQVANYILGSTKGYREERNERFSKNRKYADGRQDISFLLDTLDLNGKKSYTNIRFKPRAISNKFERIVVDGYMLQKHEYARVTSISKHIVDLKRKKRTDAQYRMDNKDFITLLSQEAGFPVEDPNAFVPESKEDLDIYFDLNDKEQEELLMQDTISYLLKNTDVESMKRTILRELYQVALVGLYDYIDNNGEWKVDIIKGEDCIYSQSDKDDFSDIHFAGRFVRMTVSKLRNRFKIKDEREFFKALKKCRIVHGGRFNYEWNDSYSRYGANRPYDGLTVELSHVWFKCSKIEEYVKGYDRYGRKVFDIGDFEGTINEISGNKSKSEGRKTVGYQFPETAYEGYILGENGYVLEWAEQKNILKNQSNGKIVCPFSFHMPENNGGMATLSFVEKIIDSIESMEVAVHKIKQAIAKSAPDGLIVDVDALEALDLGTGGALNPLDILQIYRQTGDLFYRGKKDDGTPNNIPVRPSITSIENTLRTYIETYNWELNNIRDILGINEIRDGSATSPRISFRFAQGQTEASNTATYIIYRGFLKLMTSLTERSGIRVWDNLKYGSADNRFVQYIGSKNEELIKKKIDITQCAYEFKYELTMTDEEEGILEQNIQTCLANGSLLMTDALMIRDISDYKVAQRMLAFVLEKRRKQNIEDAQQNARQQAEATAEAGASVERVKQEGDLQRAQLEKAKEDARGNNDMILALTNIAGNLISESVKTGKPIQPEFQGVIDLVFQNAGIKTSQSARKTEREMQEEEMALMQEQQMQELQDAVNNGELTEEEAMQALGGQ